MINKRELAKRVSKQTLLSQKEALSIIELTFEEIVKAMIEDDDNEVSIVGFGKFYLYKHSQRPVRNPKTQEEMILKPYKTIRFKVSNVIKGMLKRGS